MEKGDRKGLLASEISLFNAAFLERITNQRRPQGQGGLRVRSMILTF
jgi:hypothetical protein